MYSPQTHWAFTANVKYSREGCKNTCDGTLAYEAKKMDEPVSSVFF